MGRSYLANNKHNTDHHDQCNGYHSRPLLLLNNICQLRSVSPGAWSSFLAEALPWRTPPSRPASPSTSGTSWWLSKIFPSGATCLQTLSFSLINFIKLQRGRSNHWCCCHLCHRGGVQHSNRQHCGKHQHDLLSIVIILMKPSLSSLLQMPSWSLPRKSTSQYCLARFRSCPTSRRTCASTQSTSWWPQRQVLSHFGIFVSTHPSHYHNNYDDIEGVLLLCFHAASGYSSQCYCLWSKHDENCWYDEVRFRWSTLELNCIWLNKLWETLWYWLKCINIFQGWFCDEHNLHRHHLGGNEHLW